jgi:TATA-box binding protein (TBP) (component of TFIID and TFIIIB)
MNQVEVAGLPPACLVNVVCTFSLGVGLNANRLVLYHRLLFPVVRARICLPISSELQKFNDSRFAAFTVKFITEKLSEITAHVFGTGAVVLTGAYHAELARLAAWSLVLYFNKFLNIEAAVCNFTIRNIVSSFHLGFGVDLAALKLELGSRVRYDPDRFPAAIFDSALHAKATALLYDSGNGVLTGCKRFDQVKSEYVNVYSVASLFVRGKKNNFKRREFRELQVQQQRKEAGTLDVAFPEDDSPEATKAKMALVLSAYKIVSNRQRRGKKGVSGLADLGLPPELNGIMLGTDGTIVPRAAPDVIDDLALVPGLTEETILQLMVPQDLEGGPGPSRRVPVSSLDAVCYVDTSGFVHLRSSQFGDVSLENGGALPEYEPISRTSNTSKRPSERDDKDEPRPHKHHRRHRHTANL